MKTLIIYDNTGYIISNITGNYRVPTGIPYLEVEIPEGKRIKVTDGVGVDTTVAPHKVILEDIPPTETEILQKQINDLNIAMANLMGV